jgi:SAM-dependent methyltransferase
MTPDRLVVSPGLLIRAQNGELVIGTGHSKHGLSVDKNSITTLQILLRFLRPTSVTEAIDSFGVTFSAEELHRSVAALRNIGALVEAVPPGKDERQRSDEDFQQSCIHTSSMSRAVWAIANDLNAFGPSIAEPYAKTTGRSIHREIEALIARLAQLRSDLNELRVLWRKSFEERVNTLFQGSDWNLNIGSGDRPVAGWINIDLYPAEFAFDVRWGIPLRDSSVDRIYMAHVLEHFYFPGEAVPILQDLRRVLRPGGVLRIVVPDLEKYFGAYVANDEQFFRNRKSTWGGNGSSLHELLNYAGAGVMPDGFDQHKFGFDFATLSGTLRRCGFAEIRRCTYMNSSDPQLRIDDFSRVAGANSAGEHYSLFVEARP